MKQKNNEISEEIVNFLKTEHGREYFRKIVIKNGLIRKKSTPASKQALHWKKTCFLNGQVAEDEHLLLVRLLEPMAAEWVKYVDNVNNLLYNVK